MGRFGLATVLRGHHALDAGERERTFRIAHVTQGIEAGRVESGAHTRKHGTGRPSTEPADRRTFTLDLDEPPRPEPGDH